jgi:hypothetical protein
MESERRGKEGTEVREKDDEVARKTSQQTSQLGSTGFLLNDLLGGNTTQTLNC